MITYPSWWSGASFTAKAAWLRSSGHARNYPEACAMLARRPRTRKVRPTVQEYNDRLAKLNID